MKMREISWNTVERLSRELAEKVRDSNFKPDFLVAIARGGWIPGRLLSDFLLIPEIGSMRVEFYEDVGKRRKEPRITQCLSLDARGKNVLLVDDVADTGLSLLLAKKHVEEGGAKAVKTATLHYKPMSKIKPDFYVEETSDWLVYPWEKNESYAKRVRQR